jgi:hypothetical protein
MPITKKELDDAIEDARVARDRVQWLEDKLTEAEARAVRSETRLDDLRVHHNKTLDSIVGAMPPFDFADAQAVQVGGYEIREAPTYAGLAQIKQPEDYIREERQDQTERIVQLERRLSRILGAANFARVEESRARGSRNW